MNARAGRTPIEILSAGVESLSKLDEVTRAATFGSSWSAMWGMRNRIAYGYLLIDAGIARSTAERDIPGIIAQIRRAIRHSEASG